MHSRITTLQSHIPVGTAWLISNQTDIEYLTDFVSLLPTEREGFLWLTATQAYLIHASFSPAPKRTDIQFLQGCYASQLLVHLTSLLSGKIHGGSSLNNQPITSLVIDGAGLWHNEFLTVQQATRQAPGVTLTTKPQNSDQVMKMRMTKDASEITAIHTASQLMAEVLDFVRSSLRAGMTEQDVCQLLETELRSRGSLQPAFPTIVAFGSNTSLPHHQPTKTILEENMPILIDCGATHARYRSDMTRSWWFGDTPDEEYRAIEATVLDAYQAGISELRKHFEIWELTVNSGNSENHGSKDDRMSDEMGDGMVDKITAAQLDGACRTVINDAGYGSRFIHTTGHGVGLDIHEAPSIGSSNNTPLSSGMVITVEPGIYLPGSHGFRHENTVLLR